MLLHLLVSAFIASVALMILFPRTSAARAIRRVLVEAPADFLKDLTWAKAGRLALSVAAVGVLLMLPEMAMLMASLGADAAILEVMVIVGLGSMSGGVASGWRSIRRAAASARRIIMRGVRTIARPRAPGRRGGKPSQGGKEDKNGPEWAIAQGRNPLRRRIAILPFGLDQDRCLQERY